MVYFLFFLLLVFFAVSFSKIADQNREFKLAKFICFLLFFLIAGLRYEIGVDFFSYANSFDDSTDIFGLFSERSKFLNNIFSGWEPGVIILMSILKTISNDSQILFLSSSFICTVLLFRSFSFFCDTRNLFFSFLIYFCFVYMFQEMQALRQAIGANILFNAFCLLAQGMRKKAILITLLACCFHYALLLFVPFILVLDKKINVLWQIYILGVSFYVFVFRIPWMHSILGFLTSVLPGGGLLERLIGYADSDALQRPFFLTFVLYIIPYLFLLYKQRTNNTYFSLKYVVVQNVYFLYLVFTMIFWEFTFFSIRYGWICLWGMAVLLPMLKAFVSVRLKAFVSLYIIVFSFLLMRTFLFPDSTTLPFTPYEDYVSRKMLNEPGTGRQRAENYLKENGLTLSY